jgi:hypothetical protein
MRGLAILNDRRQTWCVRELRRYGVQLEVDRKGEGKELKSVVQ